MPRRIPIALSVILVSLLLSLTACSFSDDNAKAQGTAAAPVKQETIAPIPTAMDTFRALAPPEGLRFTPLFNEKISNTDARVKRLEDSVQTIRNDIDTLVPTMVRMVAIEKDIKGLVAQLQTLTDQNGQPVTAQAQPAAPVAPAQELPAPATQQAVNKIPGEDVAKGTEPAKALPADAGPAASSSRLVTPEAASTGELPPDDAASPNLKAPKAAKKKNPSDVPMPLPPLKMGGLKIPGEDVARGTEPAKALPANAGPKASSSRLVTPEAASTGELPPEDAASPISETGPHAAVGDVVNLRIADYPSKTRMVIEMTAGVATPMHLTKDGKTLIISLASLNWGGEKDWDSDHVKLITGGRVAEGNLYVNLKRKGTLKSHMLLKPSANSKNYRLVIDLGAEEKK